MHVASLEKPSENTSHIQRAAIRIREHSSTFITNLSPASRAAVYSTCALNTQISESPRLYTRISGARRRTRTYIYTYTQTPPRDIDGWSGERRTHPPIMLHNSVPVAPGLSRGGPSAGIVRARGRCCGSPPG